MIAVNIRKQGGAAIMTIPSDVLKMLNLHVGSTLQLNIVQRDVAANPVKNCPKRYSLKMLLEGITPEMMADMNAETAWAREGNPMGREEI